MKIAICILNWNGQALLERYLPSVVQLSSDADIYLIDNASSDHSVEFVANHYPQIKCVQLDKNWGYAGGYNRGLQQIAADYYILLNSDVEVTPAWINSIRHFLQQHPECELAQPKILADGQRSHFEYAGACGGFIDSLGYPYCRGRIFTTVEEDKGQYNSVIPIDWATGACLIIRSKTFHDLGGFDSDFFAHMEEIDLAWRYRNTGKTIYVIPQAVVYHLGGATLDKSHPNKTYLNFRNSLFTLIKNLPSSKIPGIIFARLVLDGVAGAQFVVQGKFSHCWAIVRAHFAFYSQVRRMYKKRSNHQIPNYYHKKSIVWSYYIRNKRIFSELF